MKYKDVKLFLTIKKYKEEYLPSLKAQSDNTINSYCKTIELYLNFLNQHLNKEYRNIVCNDFNEENVLIFLEWLSTTRKNKNKTINQRLSGIKSFCYYMKREKVLDHSYLAQILDIQKRKEEEHRIIELTSEQLKYLLSLPDCSNRFGLRDVTYMILLYDSGCRNQEILDLKITDIEFIDEVANISVTGKGNKYRRVPISQEVTKIITQYMHSYHYNMESEYLFYTKRSNVITKMSDDNGARIFNKYETMSNANGIKMPHLYPHLMRHQRALDLYRAGMPLELVSEWLGHSNLEASLIYAYADLEMKRKAVDKLIKNNSDIFKHEEFKYNEEEIIKKLCGLK